MATPPADSSSSSTTATPSVAATPLPTPAPTATPRITAQAALAQDNGRTVYRNVVYKGVSGNLTITPKVFSYESDHNDNDSVKPITVKCSWTRVRKRQLSPPGAAQPMLKLVLVSGRTAVFEVSDVTALIRLVRDVKRRMEAAPTANTTTTSSTANVDALSNTPRSVQVASGPRTTTSPEDNKDKTPSTGTPSTIEDMEQPARRRRKSKPDGDDNEEEDDDHPSWCYPCCWEDLWFLLCMGMTFVVVILVISIVYWTVLRDDPSGRSPQTPPCQGPDCPPDDGLEAYYYGIRAVEYVWTSTEVRLEYYVSDYILDTSVDVTLWDGTDCRDSENQALPHDNPYFRVDFMDGAALDGGANLDNQGRGTRQFDITIQVLPNISSTAISEAPFFVPRGVTGEKGWLRFCVDFSIRYNQYKGYNGTAEVNYIETAVQLSIDATNPTKYEEVQVKTATKPDYN